MVSEVSRISCPVWKLTFYFYNTSVSSRVSMFPGFLTLSLPRAIKFKFLLQPHQKYCLTQYEELGCSSFTQMKDDYNANSHYLTHTFLFKMLRECTFSHLRHVLLVVVQVLPVLESLCAVLPRPLPLALLITQIVQTLLQRMLPFPLPLRQLHPLHQGCSHGDGLGELLVERGARVFVGSEPRLQDGRVQHRGEVFPPVLQFERLLPLHQLQERGKMRESERVRTSVGYYRN